MESVQPLTLAPTTNTDGDGDVDGIYLGIDMVSGSKVYWNPCQSPSPHILVVGPTGSGKTVTLLSLAQRLKAKYNSSVVIFDIKDEYRYLLKLFGYHNVVSLNPLEEPLPLCFCSTTTDEKNKMVMNAVATVSKIFSLTAGLSRCLYNALLDLCTRCVDVMDLVPQRFEVYDDDLGYAVDVVTRIFNVYPEPRSTYLGLASQPNTFVVNLRPLFLKGKAESATVILYLVNTLLKSLDITLTPYARVVLVLDELWHAIQYLAEDLINILTRYGRSLGLYLIMATQNIDDLTPYANPIVSNCGVVIAMSSSSLGYWQRLRHHLNLSEKALGYVLNIGVQGGAVVRLSPYRTPILLYVDPFDDG